MSSMHNNLRYHTSIKASELIFSGSPSGSADFFFLSFITLTPSWDESYKIIQFIDIEVLNFNGLLSPILIAKISAYDHHFPLSLNFEFHLGKLCTEN